MLLCKSNNSCPYNQLSTSLKKISKVGRVHFRYRRYFNYSIDCIYPSMISQLVLFLALFLTSLADATKEGLFMIHMSIILVSLLTSDKCTVPYLIAYFTSSLFVVLFFKSINNLLPCPVVTPHHPYKEMGMEFVKFIYSIQLGGVWEENFCKNQTRSLTWKDESPTCVRCDLGFSTPVFITPSRLFVTQLGPFMSHKKTQSFWLRKTLPESCTSFNSTKIPPISDLMGLFLTSCCSIGGELAYMEVYK
ncbi:hypothetical protein EGR_08050 [Echinococcus granulosus]|uniref:Uncharacterized protein n=1 Tax=Echinococcus granulosus TaxID=6210 RepID=W6UG43_ECHGR|nr:hypothetical protein EGR_08050 [Echinococcus granulosus]EUB57102.1 hypothetical protein EGR_08050 [Echinococcus granulosus]